MFVQTTKTGERTLAIRRLKIQAEGHFRNADVAADRAHEIRLSARETCDEGVRDARLTNAALTDASADFQVAQAELLLDRARAMKAGRA
jgi:hypothetical protein